MNSTIDAIQVQNFKFHVQFAEMELGKKIIFLSESNL